ncbi:phage tail tube protein [Cytobacillus purgationiresistens]|uniref:Secreted protein n=1 Tax=Cytobacillus purgationiresistens TaxID=863449 RepID=A0ABU0AT73_9BACI|nr:phage tail tube protein [Cytobacillus purgationiresistens]MDQ0273967.1 putative secreted protein [Cytobacillus purgationiresistens]
MSLAGRNTVVKVSSDGEQFTVVQDLKEVTMPMESDNQDISTFGSNHVKRLYGLRDTSYELNGLLNLNDINGQQKIRQSLVENTPLYIQFLPDGNNGFQQEVMVASYEVSASAEGVVELAIELEGTGEVTII